MWLELGLISMLLHFCNANSLTFKEQCLRVIGTVAFHQIRPLCQDKLAEQFAKK